MIKALFLSSQMVKNTQGECNRGRSSSTKATEKSPLKAQDEDSRASQKPRSSSVAKQMKYRMARYSKITNLPDNKAGPKLQLDVEGIAVNSRGNSKGTTYFECTSHRQVNAPECFFLGRILNFQDSLLEGDIEITNDHASTCKFLVGNVTKDFTKNTTLNTDKKAYKTVKIEIEKKLEEENWLTPGEILKWVKEHFTIDMHLSYSQVDDLVQYWRKKNNIFKEFYIFEHSSNKAGLPFFRSNFTLKYKKNYVNKSLKILVWTSDFQINRLRLTDHWFIDGTFTITPNGYQQLLTIMIRDPNTGFVKPGLWALLDCKDEECYYHVFRIISEIISASESLQWTLTSATLDFEDAMMNGFTRIFPKARLIGCLFHFKQALFREAQKQGLAADTLKEQAMQIVEQLGHLCWEENKLVDKELAEIEKRHSNTEYEGLIRYYKSNWLGRLKSGLISYKDVDDDKRANSVLEGYNAHIKDCLPRSPTWPKFLDFIVSEEADYVSESFLAEQRGQVSTKSQNFGKTYLPKALKSKAKASNKGFKPTSKLSTDKTENALEEKAPKNKRKRMTVASTTSSDQAINTYDLKKTKQSSSITKDGSILYPEYIYRSAPSKDISPQNCSKKELSEDDSMTLQDSWICWRKNSCRYDTLCSVFTLSICPY